MLGKVEHESGLAGEPGSELGKGRQVHGDMAIGAEWARLSLVYVDVEAL
jgi:hypothetical protein